MRSLIAVLLVAAAVGGPAFAQQPLRRGTATDVPATGSTPAPVPAVPPPTAQSGAPGAVPPEQIAPPGIAGSAAGPANGAPLNGGAPPKVGK
jgi:hypothetical protein